MSWTALCASGWVHFRLSSGLVFDDHCTVARHRPSQLPHYGDAGKDTGCAGVAPSPWYTLGEHDRYTLADYGWYGLGDSRWYSIARLLTTSRQTRCGSPPRVWGNLGLAELRSAAHAVHPHVCGEIQRAGASHRDSHRFTPTCVGKSSAKSPAATLAYGSPPRVWGNRQTVSSLTVASAVHPHVCGEIGVGMLSKMPHDGSPPRVWGNLSGTMADAAGDRFTPTCVGKSIVGVTAPTGQRFTPTCVGKSSSSRHSRDRRRFTPTCVGKSSRRCQSTVADSVHPHVCGEIRQCVTAAGDRTRFTPTCVGKSAMPGRDAVAARFTPTCVGKSGRAQVITLRIAVHPHVCGEIVGALHVASIAHAVHPHVCGEIRRRRRRTRMPTVHPHVCGEIADHALAAAAGAVHPHVCGEIDRDSRPSLVDRGSPPRVWGNRTRRQRSRVDRFTPTCVGKSVPVQVR